LSKKIVQLDGFRAMAVLLVMCGHIVGYSEIASLSSVVEIASIGVDLFFVLSGFLITGILVRSKGSDRYYINFFGRRALRIWPLYYAFLLLLYVFGVVITVPDWNFQGHHFIWYAFYAQAVRYPVSIGPDPISITWSLAIEEQFYLIWPLIVASVSRSALRRIAWGVVIAAPLFRMLYLHLGWNPYIAFVCRSDSIALGSLVALWSMQQRSIDQRASSRAYVGMLAFGIATVVCVATPVRQTLGHSMTSAFFAATLIVVISGGALASPLSFRPLGYLGRISYCLYLVHLPVIMTLRHLIFSKLVLCLTSFALSVLIAELSRRYFEGPILSYKDRWFASPDAVPAISPAISR
jgi:peptidoglycan/LPS O-acetylase OafA/YrhL